VIQVKNIATVLKNGIKSELLSEKIIALYLYGSALTGRLRIDSDIDIAMLAMYDVVPYDRLELIADIEHIVTKILKTVGIENPVSVLDLRGKYVPFELQYKVITQGKLLFDRDCGQRYDYELALKRDYFDFIPFLEELRHKKYGNLQSKV